MADYREDAILKEEESVGNPLIDSEIEELITRTDLKCAECDTTLHLVEEVYELKVVTYQIIEDGLLCHDITTNGAFEYPPYYFNFDCWESMQEELREQVEDDPAAKIEDQFGLIGCDICESDIREGEILGLARYGELRCSAKLPSGIQAIYFEPLDCDVHICVICLHNMNHEVEYWPDGIEPIQGMDVCWEGLSKRCWRRESCDCGKRR